MNGKDTIKLDLPPVGIKLLDKETMGLCAGVKLFSGVSYCEAIFEATSGKELLVRAGSVKVCKWVPVVLGFKKAENEFERSIEPHLEVGTQGIYIAPLHLFRKGVSPDVVIIRTKPEHYVSMINILGWDSFINFTTLKQDRTALQTFDRKPLAGFSVWAVKYFNGALDFLNRFGFWHSFTTFLFKSGFVTRIFDKFITRYMANMSMCRNSFVIPFQQNKANISYFCTGGVAWGKNDSRNMTSGFPHQLFLKLEPHLEYPGKKGLDHRPEAMEKNKRAAS
ncbi:MAG: DUF169 domain-containing protein [Syntrophaceae bacterium]|nr:DUF169 domain-containing protein [Syntrophaceae bacterium]